MQPRDVTLCDKRDRVTATQLTGARARSPSSKT